MLNKNLSAFYVLKMKFIFNVKIYHIFQNINILLL